MVSNVKGSLLTAAAALASLGALANSYTIVDLGHSRDPYQIDNAGRIAATYKERRKDPRAVVMRNGRWHRLDSDPSLARAIDIGKTVGGAVRSPDGQWAPATWSADGARNQFTLPRGSTYGSIQAMSRGQVVGAFIPSAGQDSHCFIGKARGGKTKDMGLLPGGDYCYPYGINTMRQVVGTASLDTENNFRAFLWQEDNLTNLGTLPGGDFSAASAINEAGHVVGYSSGTGFSYHAFSWKEGVMTDIGAYGQFPITEALAVNINDVAVGVAINGAPHFDHHALRFESGAVIDLAAEVVDLGEWKLLTATSINDNGIIVGSGSYEGRQHGFMLIPR